MENTEITVKEANFVYGETVYDVVVEYKGFVTKWKVGVSKYPTGEEVSCVSFHHFVGETFKIKNSEKKKLKRAAVEAVKSKFLNQ